MNDPGDVQPRVHPRRPPAHQSVSLRHSPPASRLLPKVPTAYAPQKTSLSSANGPASDKANPPSSVSASINKKHSSGESSDAGRWYENTNNNAVQSNTYADNDPPFHLQHSSSSDTPPDARFPRSNTFYQQPDTLPYRPGLEHLGTDGSSTEDFRSVIDDLTVANKRLKQKLRKYEKLYDAHLQDEKLFEVRFHKLPDHKKKELEETLRKFASDLEDAPSLEQPPAVYTTKPDASAGTSRFAESGYVSMSASGRNSSSAAGQNSSYATGQNSSYATGQNSSYATGQNSSSATGQNSSAAPSLSQENSKKMSKSQFHRNQRNVQSYLHDIPAGLLPKQPTPMTERSRKKLVVRRLEQIFAGANSAPGQHPQPMQQEEVAQSAAQADRQAKEASGQLSRKEGLREARIMRVRSEDEDIAEAPPAPKLRPHSTLVEQDFTTPGSGSPDQRPTRPLDLDLERAQVPAQNMDYIRHLGFTPPDMYHGASPEVGHGWIYLNLLINMAQLHTVNVTPDFVKEAVSEYSTKFELSHDGRKIRWRGGSNLTRNSSSGSSSDNLTEQSSNDVSGTSGSPHKRLKTTHSGSTESTDVDRQARRMARALKEQEQKKYTYTPLFFHKEDSEEDEDFYGPDMSSSNSQLQHQGGDSSGFTSSNMKSSSSRKRREDGPMIFYSKAKFCTDLSGDRRGFSVMNPESYKSITTKPVGAHSDLPSQTNGSSDIQELRGPLDAQSMEIDGRDSERTTSADEDMEFSPDSLQNDSSGDSIEPMEFEASGLGGVQPDDHFAIKVKRELTSSTHTSTARNSNAARLYPPKILKALVEQEPASGPSKAAKPAISSEIVSTTQKDLPSSTLPPASFLPFDSVSSEETDDSDAESDVSSSPSTSSSSGSDGGPGSALRLLNISPAENVRDGEESSEEESDVDDEESEDGSMDILATARALEPEVIRASEREYDSNFAERLADEIPAGSSAATAGGGSGFNTPVSGVFPGNGDGEKMGQGSASASASRGSLKRGRTSDSLALREGKAKAKARKSDSSFER